MKHSLLDYHNQNELLLQKKLIREIVIKSVSKLKVSYRISNHYHPYTDEMIERVNNKSINGLLDHRLVEDLNKKGKDFFKDRYNPNPQKDDKTLEVKQPYPDEIVDFSKSGAYALYNWELFFHAPLAIAVHLSRSQRFAEAQKWFHFIFNPTTREEGDSSSRFWQFVPFRQATSIKRIKDLLLELHKPEDSELKRELLESLDEWRRKPFQPHVVARGRFFAYQYNVIMKYIDNLIAWGDFMFRQDTSESIDEALTQYRIAEAILGPKPQRVPAIRKPTLKTYAQLREEGIDALSNALVKMESELPFNYLNGSAEHVNTTETNTLIGVGKLSYFGIPQNERLLKYWETVQDRLNKIHNCQNIEGIVRQLALFDPPIDPALLVKAVARGLDVASIMGGVHQPVSLMRAPLMIQKALEICSEVKSLGSQLLAIIERKEAEELALLRQSHEIKVLRFVEDVRYLQWKEAEESTNALLKSRETIFHRYKHYQMMLGKLDEENNKVELLGLERKAIDAENFEEVYNEFVERYSTPIKLEENIKENLDFIDSAADTVSGVLNLKSDRNLNLNKRENIELNVFMPMAHLVQQQSAVVDLAAGLLGLIPQFNAHGTPLGVGAAVGFGGRELSTFTSSTAKAMRIYADSFSYQGNRAAKLAGYQRRAEDWVLQNNLAASDLMLIGKQLIASLIREQITRKEYENHKVQIEQAEATITFMQEKSSNKDLYSWMQGEVQRLYYDCYKFAFDVAKKAEQTIRHELLQENLDNREFISFGYWDSGKKGLLAGDKLYFDIKRMEMSYHDFNRREYERVKHISLQSLDAGALLKVKFENQCEFQIPEWLFDLDGPGEYMRRIKSVSISIPAVVGPYTSVSCKASLLKSSIRKSPLLTDEGRYERNDPDARFVDLIGAVETIVTSGGQGDSGLFELSLQGERYLPFEGKGIESTWRLELPEHDQFDYKSISDIIIHIRFTSREGGIELKERANEYLTKVLSGENGTVLFRVFSLQHEFPSEWNNYLRDREAGVNIKLEVNHFPYLHHNKIVLSEKLKLAVVENSEGGFKWMEVDGEFSLGISRNIKIPPTTGHVYLLVPYKLRLSR